MAYKCHAYALVVCACSSSSVCNMCPMQL